MVPQPILLALLLCDLTIRDEITKKMSIIGCFSHFFTKEEAPIRCKSFTVYISLVEGMGKVKITAMIRNLKTDSILMSNDIAEIEFRDPLQPFEFTIDVGNPVFPDFGKYAIEIYANESILGSRTINVSKLPI